MNVNENTPLNMKIKERLIMDGSDEARKVFDNSLDCFEERRRESMLFIELGSEVMTSLENGDKEKVYSKWKEFHKTDIPEDVIKIHDDMIEIDKKIKASESEVEELKSEINRLLLKIICN